jgi:hypothetical protein
MKKLFLIVAIAAALAVLGAVGSGWKWGHAPRGAVSHFDNVTDGWTWEGVEAQ